MAVSQAWTERVDNPALIGPISYPNAASTLPASAGQATGWSATGYSPTVGTAANAGQATQTNSSTVQGILAQIMSQDNPLMQMARTSAEQDMARRGLSNSSMAIEAGQRALYGVAMPIAGQDSQMLNQTSMFNADARNNMAQFNAANQQQTNLSNQAAQNQAGQFGAEATNTAAAQNAAAANNMAQFNANNAQQANLANMQANQQMAQFNAANNLTAQQTNASILNQAMQFNAQQANAQSQFNASQSNEVLRNQLEFANRKELANIESSYKTLMQANQSAGELYQQTIKNITDIASNRDMDPDTKTSAINAQLSYLRTGVQMFERMNNMSGLSQILNF